MPESQRPAGRQGERKTTAAYYTPSSLVECLLDSALEPLLDEAMNAEDREAALLSHTVCDPSCGSGAFLVGAARRIAGRLVLVRTGNPFCSPAHLLDALHDVIARCIYGVDLNPLAVELAKLTLWLECFRPEYPLPFLDHHLKCGNALIGATPALLAGGIPDEAFKPIEGDDPKIAAALRRRNAAERAEAGGLFATPTTPAPVTPTPRRLPDRERDPVDYFSPFGTQLVDPDALRAAVDREMQEVTPSTTAVLIRRVARARWLAGLANSGKRHAHRDADVKAAIKSVNDEIDADPIRHFDVMMYGTGPQADRALEHLAFVLAHLAHAPGGITFAGHHWCTDHAACREAEAWAKVQPRLSESRPDEPEPDPRPIVDVHQPEAGEPVA